MSSSSSSLLLSTDHVRELRSLYNFLSATDCVDTIQWTAILKHCRACDLPMNETEARRIIEVFTDTHSVGVSFENFLAFYATKCTRSTLSQDMNAVFRLLDIHHTGRVKVAQVKQCLMYMGDVSAQQVDEMLIAAFPNRQPIADFAAFGEMSFLEFQHFMQN